MTVDESTLVPIWTPEGSTMVDLDNVLSSSVKPRQIVGGHPIVGIPARQITNVVSPNSVLAGRVPQVALGPMTGVRFWYAQEPTVEFASDNEIIVEAALEYQGVRYPMTFNGNQWGILGRYGFLGTDPGMVDIAKGDIYYVLSKYMAPNNTSNFNPGNGYTTLAADVIAGATQITLTDKPIHAIGGGNPIRLRIGGAGAEVVEVWKITGTASPYTAFLRTALVSPHTAAGSVVGQGVCAQKIIYSDQITGGSSANAPQFDILTGTFTTPAASASTTIVAAASIGDTKIQIAAANGSTQPGQVRNLDTAGNLEAVTIRTITGTANPFTAYLAAPLTKAHSSGVALAATISIDAVPAPHAITSDYTGLGTPPGFGSAIPPSVIGLGDSIMLGAPGNYFRTNESWMTLALDGSRAVLQMARSGESAQQFAANTNGYQRRRLFDLGRWLLLAYGTNDLYGARSLAQLQADIATIVGWARARGMQIAIATITPRTSSTDGWETVANQTLQNGTANTARIAFNAWVMGGAGGLCDVGVDVASAVEVNAQGVAAVGGGFWKADTTTGPYTVDGLHPSYSGHQAIAAIVNPALFV